MIALVVAMLLASGLFTPAQATAGEAETETFELVSAPGIFGTPRVGDILHANQGEWSPFPSDVRFTWLRDGEPIPEAPEKDNYLVQTADVGHLLSARVTINRPGYAEAVGSTAELGPADDDLPLYGPLGFVWAVPVPGMTLDSNPAPWISQTREDPDARVEVEDVDYTYRWVRQPGSDGPVETIQDATTRFYTVTEDDLGDSIGVYVTGSKPGYFESTGLHEFGQVFEELLSVSVPKVSGSPRIGSTLTGTHGVFNRPENEYFRPKMQWLRNGVRILGATSSTYQLTSADAGQLISLRVTGSSTSLDRQSLSHTSPTVQPRYSSTTTLKATPGTKGKVTLYVRVTGPSTRGPVRILDGSRVIRSNVMLSNRTAKIALSYQRKGKHTYTAQLMLQPTVAGSSGKATVTVK